MPEFSVDVVPESEARPCAKESGKKRKSDVSVTLGTKDTNPDMAELHEDMLDEVRQNREKIDLVQKRIASVERRLKNIEKTMNEIVDLLTVTK
jgi:t-SNARE complex subunit (syntaxin)